MQVLCAHQVSCFSQAQSEYSRKLRNKGRAFQLIYFFKS